MPICLFHGPLRKKTISHIETKKRKRLGFTIYDYLEYHNILFSQINNHKCHCFNLSKFHLMFNFFSAILCRRSNFLLDHFAIQKFYSLFVHYFLELPLPIRITINHQFQCHSSSDPDALHVWMNANMH
jgi:hypothetical protein